MRKKILINTDFIKLSTFLKLTGTAATGGQAKQTILSGKVRVNKEVCLICGKKLHDKDVVTLEHSEYEVINSASNKT